MPGRTLREQGKRVVCVIPKKGHEFRPNCEQLGGLYLRLSPSSRDCPNIMAIRRKTLDAYAGIQELAARDDSVLADKISRLIIWYSLQKKDLTEEDKNYLDASLVECYDRYGITFDNASVVDENGAFKEMPIIPDWYNVLLEKAETKHLAVVLTRYVTGSAAAMGRRNHISIDNKYIVLDTSGMPDDLILPGIYWAIDVANDIIMNAGGELSALIADELWSLVAPVPIRWPLPMCRRWSRPSADLAVLPSPLRRVCRTYSVWRAANMAKAFWTPAVLNSSCRWRSRKPASFSRSSTSRKRRYGRSHASGAGRACCASGITTSPWPSMSRKRNMTPLPHHPPTGRPERKEANEQTN